MAAPHTSIHIYNKGVSFFSERDALNYSHLFSFLPLMFRTVARFFTPFSGSCKVKLIFPLLRMSCYSRGMMLRSVMISSNLSNIITPPSGLSFFLVHHEYNTLGIICPVGTLYVPMRSVKSGNPHQQRIPATHCLIIPEEFFRFTVCSRLFFIVFLPKSDVFPRIRSALPMRKVMASRVSASGCRLHNPSAPAACGRGVRISGRGPSSDAGCPAG